MNALHGQTVSCLEPILPGERVPRWGYADPYLMSRVEKMFITETSATVYKYHTKDSKTWPVIETWTKDTVKRLNYQDITKIDTGNEVRYDLTQLKKLDPESTEEIRHGLGCMPIDEIRNKQKHIHPMIDIWNWKYELATWHPVKGMITNTYEFIKQFIKNVIISKPRMTANADSKTIMAMNNEADWTPYLGDLLCS